MNAETSPATVADGGPGSLLAWLGRHVVARSLLVVVLLEIVLFSVASSRFLSVQNFMNISVQMSIIGIVSVAFGLLLMTGFIDLSVGSTLALTAVVAGVCIKADQPVVVAVAAAIAVGALVGAVNGTLTAVLGFSPIIVTLGTLTAVRGLAIGLSETTPANFGAEFKFLGQGYLGPLPVPVWLLIAAFLIGAFVLHFTPVGRHIFAVGVNREAAFLSGIAVRRIPFVLAVVVGIACAVGGVIMAARIDAAPGGTVANGFEMNVLTAVLLGGVAFGGGRGGVFGMFLGVAFMAILQNGLTILNVSNTMQMLLQGLVLVVAAALEWFSSRSSTR